MSDPMDGGTSSGTTGGGGGGGGGGSPTTSAKIEIDVSELVKLIPISKGVASATEANMKQVDRALKIVQDSLKVLSAQAKKDLEEVKNAGKSTALAIEQAKGKNLKTQGVNQAAQQDHQQIMKNLQLQGQAANNNHARYMQNSRTRSQTSKQNHQVVMAGYNQQNLALKSTNQILKQNHQTNMQQGKQSHQLVMAGIGQQNLALKQTGQIMKQNHQTTIQQSNQAHQIVMSNLTAQNKMAVNSAKVQGQMQVIAARQSSGGGGLGGGLAGVVKGLGGGLGKMVGIAAGSFIGGQLAQAVVDTTGKMWENIKAADEVARAYDRQNLAGRTLAGTQEELNKLLAIYDKATGGAVSKSNQMANVVRLQAVGFADTTKELDQFSRAIRGISLAIGEPADFVTQNLILELFSQRGQRLDQLGLQYDDVRKRQEALMRSDSSLTKQQAYQAAVLQQALQRYGKLSDSLEGQATGVERLTAAWDDLGLAMAQWIQERANPVIEWLADITEAAVKAAEELNKVKPADQTPVTGVEGGLFPGDTTSLANQLTMAQKVLDTSMAKRAELMAELTEANMGKGVRSSENIARDLATVEANIKAARVTLFGAAAQAFINRGGVTQGAPDTTIGGNRLAEPSFTEEQEQELIDYSRARRDIERETAQAILDENTEYKNKRIDMERDFNQQMSEEAEDFARQRARDIAEHEKDVAKLLEDSAEKQLDIQKDLAKSIERANRDHARQIEKWERDHGRRLNDLNEEAAKDEADVNEEYEEKQRETKEESAKRIAEMEDEFGREREKAQQAHNDSILESAARLDAAAVFWEQKKFARERKEAEEEHARSIRKEQEGLEEELGENTEDRDKRIEEIKKNLQEQIDEENEAHKLRLADANEAHQQQLADQQAAAAERLEEQKIEDAERLAEMKQSHIDRMKEEDIDRGIRLQREYSHHNAQLLEIDRLHGERLSQITKHAGEEKTKLDEAHTQRLTDLGVHNSNWLEKDRRAKNIALKEHEIFLLNERKQTLEARKQAMLDKLNDPAIPQAERTAAQAAYNSINNLLGGLVTAIGEATTELGNLPKPEDVGLVTGSSSSTDLVSQSSVDLGMWTGKTGTPGVPGIAGAASMLGGTNITIEKGAIVITPLPGQSAAAVGEDFENRLLKVLQKVARTG